MAMGSACSTPKPSAAPAREADAREDLALLAEQGQQLQSTYQAETNRVIPGPGAMIIQPGDQLRFEVWLKDRVSQLSGFPVQAVVADAGDVFLPHLGTFPSSGKTTSQLTEDLKSKLDPMLSESYVVITLQREKITSSDNRSSVELGNHVLVLGFVARPGLYQLHPGLHLRDVLGMAGDFTRYANKTLYLVRGDRVHPEVVRIHMDDVLKGRNLSGNVLLAANDAVYVSPKKLWEVADFISLLFMPIVNLRDAFWVYDRVAE
ncbi:MAG: polysaccharide biosynthesis/export family protein [Lentisphaerota bacterium]